MANIDVVRGGTVMDKFAWPAVDPLYPDTNSCIASLRSNRIKRMNVDKSAGWRSWISYGTGKTYWHNEVTGETSWQRPKGAPDRANVLKPLNAAPPIVEASVDFMSLDPLPGHADSPGLKSDETGPESAAPKTAVGAGRPILPRSCYRRKTFKRLHHLAELAPAHRPPPLEGSATARETRQQHGDVLLASGSQSHRDRRALKSYLESIIEREAGKWDHVHHSIKVKEARSAEDYWARLDAIHESMHAAFKQMLVAGLHCMDFVLSVNGNNQDYISAAECVRVASKLGVRTEQHEIESLFYAYGDREDSMDLETFANVFVNVEAINEKMMAPALVGKLEGVEGTRRIAVQEAEDAARCQRRLGMREACTDLGKSIGNAMLQQSKAERKAHKQQLQEGKKIDREVMQAAKLKDFMLKHADKFNGTSGEGKFLWKLLEGVRREEERGNTGLRNRSMRMMTSGMIKEWQKLVAGQAARAEKAYVDIDKATKRLDSKAIFQIVNKKLKYLTTSWVRTKRAGLLALGAVCKVGDPQATQIGLTMLNSVESALREGACKLFGMILDVSQKDALGLMYKLTSRRESPEVRNAAKKAAADIMWRAKGGV